MRFTELSLLDIQVTVTTNQVKYVGCSNIISGYRPNGNGVFSYNNTTPEQTNASIYAVNQQHLNQSAFGEGVSGGNEYGQTGYQYDTSGGREQTSTNRSDINSQLAAMGITQRSFAEIRNASDKQRKDMRKKLTAMKKQWRKEEADEQRKRDKTIAEFRAAGCPVDNIKDNTKVQKKELPWWLESYNDVPSNSEDEGNYERMEEEREHNQSQSAPFGPTMFSQWCDLMDRSSGEDSDDKKYGDAYLSDDNDDVTVMGITKQGEQSNADTNGSDMPGHVKVLLNQVMTITRPPVPTENARRMFTEGLTQDEDAIGGLGFAVKNTYERPDTKTGGMHIFR